MTEKISLYCASAAECVAMTDDLATSARKVLDVLAETDGKLTLFAEVFSGGKANDCKTSAAVAVVRSLNLAVSEVSGFVTEKDTLLPDDDDEFTGTEEDAANCLRLAGDVGGAVLGNFNRGIKSGDYGLMQRLSKRFSDDCQIGLETMVSAVGYPNTEESEASARVFVINSYLEEYKSVIEKLVGLADKVEAFRTAGGFDAALKA